MAAVQAAPITAPSNCDARSHNRPPTHSTVHDNLPQTRDKDCLDDRRCPVEGSRFPQWVPAPTLMRNTHALTRLIWSNTAPAGSCCQRGPTVLLVGVAERRSYNSGSSRHLAKSRSDLTRPAADQPHDEFRGRSKDAGQAPKN